jgi:hypothetical protein
MLFFRFFFCSDTTTLLMSTNAENRELISSPQQLYPQGGLTAELCAVNVGSVSIGIAGDPQRYTWITITEQDESCKFGGCEHRHETGGWRHLQMGSYITNCQVFTG